MFPYSKALLLTGFSIVCCNVAAQAQVHIVDLVRSAPVDAQRMAEAYIDPLFKSLGMGLATGWNNTAKVKKPGRFDIRVGGSGVFIPTADKTFDVTRIGLSDHVRPKDPGQTITPTVGGKNVDGPAMNVYDDNGNLLQSFNMPRGINYPMIPVPQIQAAVGLPRGIGVALRVVPTINLGSDFGKVSMYGGGIKLDIMPLLMGERADKLLPIDIAVAANYAQVNYRLGLNLPPQLNSVPKDGNQSTDFSNQRVEAKVAGMNIEVIVSKKLSFFTPFASGGFNQSKIDGGLRGNYPIITGINTVTRVPEYTTYTDPINIKRTGISALRATIGFQLNLPVFRFYADYNVSQYNCLNAGIGVGIGK